jgi:hypothetical protein
MLSPAAIVYGQPTRRLVPFFAGHLILIAMTVLLIASGTSTFQNINWYQFKPTWLVLRDLNSQNPASVQTAWSELARRDGLGSLSADTREKLVQFALTQQAIAKSPYSTLDTDTINYLGQRISAGDLPEKDKTKFVDQCMRITLSVRPIVIDGDFVPYQIADADVGPSSIAIKRTIISGTLDGKKIDVGGGSSESSGFADGTLSSSVPCPGVGEHELSMVCQIEIFNGPVSNHPSNPIATIDRKFTQPFVVVAKNSPPTVSPAFDPKLESAILSAMQPHDFKFNSKSPHRLDGEIRITNIPANIAADVYVSYAGHEQKLNTLTYTANNGPWDCGIGGEISAPPPAKIDVILRPSATVATGTVNMQTYWNHELVFHDVPVTKN